MFRRIRITTWLTAGCLVMGWSFSKAYGQQRSSGPVGEAQRRLLGLSVPDDMDTNVPRDVRDGVFRLKEALVAQSDTVMARIPADATVSTMQQGFEAAMPEPNVGKPSDEEASQRQDEVASKPVRGLYGGELHVEVSEPAPGLVLVQERFNIACGTDTVLLGYRRTGGGWRRVLRWQSKPYGKISDAYGDYYKTLLLRPQHNGHPLVLVVHGTPWCTSTMSVFAMDVLEVTDGTDARVFWHGEHDYRRLDLDPPMTVKPTANGFEIRTSVSTSGDRVSRKGVLRYAVAATSMQRTEPLAINARDSVEEWLALPRTEAAAFADEPEQAMTWKMWEAFTFAGRKDANNVPHAGVGAVRACTDAKTHFQAEVTSEVFGNAGESRPGPAYFVQLREVANGYRIERTTVTPEAACKGPDLTGGT